MSPERMPMPRFRSLAAGLVPLLALQGIAPDVPPGPVAKADRGEAHFSPAWHAGRRAALRDAVGQRKPKAASASAPASGPAQPAEPKGTIVVRGAPRRRDYERFRQTNEFFYLTGVEAPDAALVIDVESGREVLFLAPPGRGEGVWEDLLPHAPTKPADGAPARGAAAAEKGAALAKALGFADVRSTEDFEAALKERAPGGPFFTLLSTEEYEATSRDDASDFERSQQADPFDGRPSRTVRFGERLRERISVEVQDLTPFLDRLRRVKTPEEIAAMRRAAEISAAGHVAAMRGTRPGLVEWQLGAEAFALFHRMGSPTHSYFAIVGAGKKATILHTTSGDAIIQPDDVILMDYAAEWRYYASDVTRSWPASGKFGEKARRIYETVQRAQEAAIAKVRPGVKYMDLERAASEVLEAAGFPRMKYMPHSLSHTIGLATHDVGRIDPIVPGVVFTIEPGIYDAESGIGVRIEDVIAVTETGCDNLSASAPRKIEEIEAIVGRAAR